MKIFCSKEMAEAIKETDFIKLCVDEKVEVLIEIKDKVDECTFEIECNNDERDSLDSYVFANIDSTEIDELLDKYLDENELNDIRHFNDIICFR